MLGTEANYRHFIECSYSICFIRLVNRIEFINVLTVGIMSVSFMFLHKNLHFSKKLIPLQSKANKLLDIITVTVNLHLYSLTTT